jgi:ferrochelatase
LIKGPSAVRAYESIGGGSPQLKWTRLQAKGLRDLLQGPDAETRVAVGMRAWRPSIEDGLRDLKSWGAEELVLLPLFPQYSTTTTGSCFKEARRILAKLNWNPSLREIARWPDQPEYIALLRKTVDEAARAAGVKAGESTHLLFSAHSLPLKIVERGDPYPEDVRRTLEAATRGLDVPWSLAYQSRNGKLPWLEPYTEDEIRRLAGEGVKHLAIASFSFVSDHIETLYELDQLYAGLAREHGIQTYVRARAFNDDPEFARVLQAVIDS